MEFSNWREDCSSYPMITDDDYLNIATTLIRRHGVTADLWADLAIQDLDQKGEESSALHWRALREVIADIVETTPGAAPELAVH